VLLDVPVLRVPVKVSASPCNPAVITNLNLIQLVQLQQVIFFLLNCTKQVLHATFNTSNLIGTLSAPSGVMEFIVTDTVNNDTNNYWLAYDVSSSALNNNALDARFDSTEVFGTFRLPINGNPTGNRTIANL
jgi:hypothetical protein